MKKISTLKVVLSVTMIMIPVVAFAQVSGADVAKGIGSLSGLVDVVVGTLVKSLATLFLSAALLVFFYGIVEYIWGKRQGEAAKIKVGNDFMKWGLVALFVMFSVYGIIQLFQGILFSGKDITTITIPNIEFKTGNANSVRIAPSTPGNPLQGNPPAGSTQGGVLSPRSSGGAISPQSPGWSQGISGCASYTQTECGNAGNCQWQGTALQGSCSDKTYGSTVTGCSSYTQTECGNAGNCQWQGTALQGSCLDKTYGSTVTGCSSYTQAECIGNCEWQGTALQGSCSDVSGGNPAAW